MKELDVTYPPEMLPISIDGPADVWAFTDDGKAVLIWRDGKWISPPPDSERDI